MQKQAAPHDLTCCRAGVCAADRIKITPKSAAYAWGACKCSNLRRYLNNNITTQKRAKRKAARVAAPLSLSLSLSLALSLALYLSLPSSNYLLVIALISYQRFEILSDGIWKRKKRPQMRMEIKQNKTDGHDPPLHPGERRARTWQECRSSTLSPPASSTAARCLASLPSPEAQALT